jgi:hypothetical protein
MGMLIMGILGLALYVCVTVALASYVAYRIMDMDSKLSDEASAAVACVAWLIVASICSFFFDFFI